MSQVGTSLYATNAYQYNGYLNGLSKQFDQGVKDLQSQLNDAISDMTKSPSDPVCLATYQAVMSEYNLYRNAQTSSVKAMKDIDSSIVSNFR
ncbi:type III secretion system protein PrgI [Burkholderia ubonensis]|uniref:type III secretion system needle complex protein n=1 Tax=Burkholderia ubonensis TaxID=101571 RepID=UPI0007544E32|nr:type III secretion system needle complex protein [Burkholderia ubonensis]KVM73937.1 type III secretion system protein PrgI [Burkholderia ubonensis]